MKTKLAIITGGPSAERGISLNSARSVYDHLDKSTYDISILYVNPRLEWFSIVPRQIYSNTPSDFDYQLQQHNKALPQAAREKILQEQDIVFPAIHGTFGEDGQLQAILERCNVPFVGSSSIACAQTSDKFRCQEVLRDAGFFTLTTTHVLAQGESLPTLPQGRRVVKPLHGGSSIGVHFFETTEDLTKHINDCFVHEPTVLIEPWVTGEEFTILILQNADKKPVALLPTQIGLQTDAFFDYRKKYLASTDTAYHTPPLRSDDITEKIQHEAERAFTVLGMKDVVRMDGWILEDGTLRFSDINAICGMEQNSFLFQQTSLLGRTHQQTLEYIIHKSHGSFSPLLGGDAEGRGGRELIPVIFGGNTAERQVSILSGTNVLMKLQHSSAYQPQPIVLTTDDHLFHIPLHICLYHTVEEMQEKIATFQDPEQYQKIRHYQQKLSTTLGVDIPTGNGELFVPHETTREELGYQHDFLFLGLHGGEGENGVIQAKLQQLGVHYNGPDSVASALCADKVVTKKHIDEAHIPGVRTARSTIIALADTDETIREQIQTTIPSTKRIIKPIDDGCSAGVVACRSLDELQKILSLYRSGATYIPPKAIHPLHDRIELPTQKADNLLVEEFIETDRVTLKNLTIIREPTTNYIEVSIGVLGRKGSMHAFPPSQTIVGQSVLSIEEKFMGGTGINLTPPPAPFVTPEAVDTARKSIEKVADILELSDYSRIDTFMHTQTGELIVIEVNTLPALTPSTILFHQGLARLDPLLPLELIEKIIEYGR